MNRPKFRVWDKVAEDMFIPEVLELDKYGKVTGIFSKGTMFSIEDFELLQSTGLKDINGTEIYEGDVVKIDNHPLQVHKAPFSGLSIGLNINGNYVVEYSTEDMAYFIGNWNTREVIRHSEVIGNKYEHPHLLEEE